jgi:hypothetical protein
LALAAVLASATTSIDAFVIPIVRKTITTKRRISTSVATSTSLLLDENDEGIVVDAINSNNNELQIMNDESMTLSSLTLAAEATGEVEELQEVKATESPSSPLSASSSLSTPTLSLTPGILAGVSFGTVVLGGLVTARSMLSQRQKKLDEEKMTLEEEQKRLETEATKLQKEKSQNKNLLLVRTR